MIDPHTAKLGISAATFLALAASASICGTPLSAQTPNAQPGAARAAADGGIWKAAVPAKPMQSEFDGFDPLGIAAGAKIKADCSLNWIDPDDDKRYCFSSGTSLEYFLDQPRTNIERARRSWRKMTADRN
jgi:hypothetical protein